MNPRNARSHRLLVAGLATVAVAAGAYVLVGQDTSAERQAEVAARSRQVMPFDLDRTTHRFAKGATGGLQTVSSDDPADARQITLIREHLTEESARFTQGDYGDPASIHGGEMPGLRDLEAGHDRIDVRYTETADGAQISYVTSDTALVKALHAWFDAQVSDHGQHAEHG
ncbi:aspartate carbamoyltransferase [Nonomuraea terrae]|uniref:Aspartate carbamoyltransferase n=1 Tax=Nonomuraea terrae TaxID=2530383 RepID=A0A4R4ZIL3_9ACTN|nr:aspartate carbamoyltransferase [Nonomuraea terrae]TDD56482.1 aspartate carbamoyltransferase [Nonomuraea terrae]